MTALLTLAKSLGIDPGALNQSDLQEQTCGRSIEGINTLKTEVKMLQNVTEAHQQYIYELAAKVERLRDVLANFYDYVHCERMSTDGAVNYSTSTINHHAYMALNAIHETPPAALAALKAQWNLEAWPRRMVFRLRNGI